MLIKTQTDPIYRHSTKASFYVWDSRSLVPLSESGKQRDATFSPDASKVAYSIDNNLYYKDLTTGKEVQITKDGKKNAIINGAADWVYEEEFSFAKAFHWSPTAKKSPSSVLTKVRSANSP